MGTNWKHAKLKTTVSVSHSRELDEAFKQQLTDTWGV